MKLNFELFYWDYMWFIWATLVLVIVGTAVLVHMLKKRRAAAVKAEALAKELATLPDTTEHLLKQRAADITAQNSTAEDRLFHVNEIRFAFQFMLKLGIDAPGPWPLRDIMLQLQEGITSEAEKFLAWYANENRPQLDEFGEPIEGIGGKAAKKDPDALAAGEANPFDENTDAASSGNGEVDEAAGPMMPPFDIADAARALAAFVLLRDKKKAERCYKLAVKKSDNELNHLLRYSTFLMRGDDPQKARQSLTEVLEVAEGLEDEENIARARLALGRLALQRGQTKKARRYLTAAADYGDASQSRDIGALAHRGLGEVMLKEKDFDNALAELNQALQLEKVIGFNDFMATTYRRISEVRIGLGELEEAHVCLRQAKSLLDILDEKVDIAQVLREQAAVLRRMKAYEKASNRLDEAMAIAKGIKQHLLFADMLCDKAVIETLQKEFKKAEALLGRAILIHQKLKNVSGQAKTCRILAELYEKQEDNARAIGVAREAERLYKESKDKESALRMTSWIGRLRAGM